MILSLVLDLTCSKVEAYSIGLQDLLLLAVMCDVEVVHWLLQRLITDVKHLVSQFSVIVPESVYLPAPPIYCLQPTQSTEACITTQTLYVICSSC